MSNVIDLTVDWERGTIKQALAQLPDKMTEAGMQALNEGADFMKIMAKTLVRVDTGTLQKSIRKERSPTRNAMTVRAGGYFVNPKTGRLCNYAHWVEMHYPYMRPAWEMTRPFIVRKIRENVLEAVKT